MTRQIDISILLPVKNGEKYLDRALQSIRGQRSSRVFEVLAVDSGSTDRSVHILKTYDVPVVHIHPRDFNHGLTRKQLAEMAKGRFLIFMNQDVRFCSNQAIDRLAENMDADDVAAVFARQKAGEDCMNILWRKEIQDGFRERRREITGPVNNVDDWKEKFPLLSTACAMIRSDLLKDHPFSEIISGEDQEWAVRILNKGYKIVYDPAVETVHSHDASLRGIYQYHYSVGEASRMFGLEKNPPAVALYRSMLAHLKFIRTSDFKAVKKIIFGILLPFQVFAAQYGMHKGMKAK